MDTQTMKDLREELGLTDDGGQNGNNTPGEIDSGVPASGEGQEVGGTQPAETQPGDGGNNPNGGTPDAGPQDGAATTATNPGNADGGVADPAGGEDPQGDRRPDAGTETAQEPELILGKFKTTEDLATAYQNLQKKFTESTQTKKEVETIASDEFDQAVKQKIAEVSWGHVKKAFETITNPEHSKEAMFLLEQYRKTNDPKYLEDARGYLDKRVDRRLEVDCMNTAAHITQVANMHRQEILLKPLANTLDEMAEQDPEFFNNEDNQNLMTMAIKLNPIHVDVRAVKKAISEYQKKQYDRGYAAGLKEAAKKAETVAPSIKSRNVLPQEPVKKPISKMTTEEMLLEEMKDFN